MTSKGLLVINLACLGMRLSGSLRLVKILSNKQSINFQFHYVSSLKMSAPTNFPITVSGPFRREWHKELNIFNPFYLSYTQLPLTLTVNSALIQPFSVKTTSVTPTSVNPTSVNPTSVNPTSVNPTSENLTIVYPVSANNILPLLTAPQLNVPKLTLPHTTLHNVGQVRHNLRLANRLLPPRHTHALIIESRVIVKNSTRQPTIY